MLWHLPTYLRGEVHNSIIFQVQPCLAQAVDDAFDNVFKIYVMSDQHTAAGWKVGLELEQIFNSPLSLLDPAQLVSSSLTVIARKSGASKL